MPKLNQIIAVVSGKKSRAIKSLTEAHRSWNKDAIRGIMRTYKPDNEEDPGFPTESNLVQLFVNKEIQKVVDQQVDFFDVVATQEFANQQAKADIKIDSKTVLENVPISVLLFLEKRLIDLSTFVSNLPTLDMDKQWEFDNNTSCWTTKETRKVKTQKIPVKVVKFEPTQFQPGQAEIVYEDKGVGEWSERLFSSAIHTKTKEDILKRIDILSDAVKQAREQANSIEAKNEHIGAKIMDFIFGNLAKGEQK